MIRRYALNERWAPRPHIARRGPAVLVRNTQLGGQILVQFLTPQMDQETGTSALVRSLTLRIDQEAVTSAVDSNPGDIWMGL